MTTDLTEEIFELARRHGLSLHGKLEVNEIGLDFRVLKARDTQSVFWGLRVPRRQDAAERIEREARILSWLSSNLPFKIPDWRVASPELVAYPWMADDTAIDVDASTHAITWHVDRTSVTYAYTLGEALASLHGVSLTAAESTGLPNPTIDEVRRDLLRDLDIVTSSFDVQPKWRDRVRAWIDDDSTWPSCCKFIHGDLYAGHVLVNKDQQVTGMIDWSEAGIGDPGLDFVGHLQLFGDKGLSNLLKHYERCGGYVWPTLDRHTTERMAAGPLKYAMFALRSKDPTHSDTAAKQLAAL